MTPNEAKAREMLRARLDISNAVRAVADHLDPTDDLASRNRLHIKDDPGPAREHLELYNLFRDYLKHEDDLINNRLNWNFTIQGFLFAAYSLSLHKIADIKLALLQNTIETSRLAYVHLFHTLFDLHLLLTALALAGINVSGFVYLSVRAARIAIHELESRWFEIDPTGKPTESFAWWSWLRVEVLRKEDKSFRTHGKNPPGLPGLIGGGHQGANWLGFHAPSGLPLSIVGIWVLLLVDAVANLW